MPTPDFDLSKIPPPERAFAWLHEMNKHFDTSALSASLSDVEKMCALGKKSIPGWPTSIQNMPDKTPLFHRAIEAGHFRAVMVLQTYGLVDPNARTPGLDFGALDWLAHAVVIPRDLPIAVLGEWLIDLGADPKGDNRSSPVAPRPLVSALSQDQYINSPFQKSINKTPEAEKKSEENDQQMTSWVERLLERGASFQDSFDEPEHNYLTSVPEWKSPPKPEDYTVATWAKKARHGVFFARHLDQWIDYENTVARAIAHRDAISVSLSDIPAPTKKSKKNM